MLPDAATHEKRIEERKKNGECSGSGGLKTTSKGPPMPSEKAKSITGYFSGGKDDQFSQVVFFNGKSLGKRGVGKR